MASMRLNRALSASCTVLIVCAACAGDPAGPPSGQKDPPSQPAPPLPPPPPPAATLVVSPAVTAVAPGAQANFTASAADGSGVAVIWRLESAEATTGLGSIEANGRYVAPLVPDSATTIRLVALNAADTTRQASAVILLLPSSTGPYHLTFPRVVDLMADAAVHHVYVAAGGTTKVEYVQPNGVGVSFARAGGDAWILTIDAAAVAAGYQNGELHRTLGYIDVFAGATRTQRLGFSVSVRDPGMPPVPITRVAIDAQRSPYVLNLRWDAMTRGAPVPPQAIARALQLLGDRFDFVIVVEAVSANANRFYVGVRNDIRGLGLPIHDGGAPYGSRQQLQGIIQFPLLAYFDPGESVLSHELGHRWINFGSHPLTASGRPHWPAGGLAFGIMGLSLTGGAGGAFPFIVSEAPNGAARLTASQPALLFNAMELYLMGLVPPDSVPSFVQLPSGTPSSAFMDGAVIAGATKFTAADWVSVSGARNPDWSAAPREFRIATVVLSHGRLLSASEMAHMDAAAARAEARVPLPYSIGFSRGVTYPFFLATGGRASVVARLP